MSAPRDATARVGGADAVLDDAASRAPACAGGNTPAPPVVAQEPARPGTPGRPPEPQGRAAVDLAACERIALAAAGPSCFGLPADRLAQAAFRAQQLMSAASALAALERAGPATHWTLPGPPQPLAFPLLVREGRAAARRR